VAGRAGRFYRLTQTADWQHVIVLRTSLPGTGDDLVVVAYRNHTQSTPTVTRDELVRVAAGVRALPVGYPWIDR
jgi:hypothetical protein